MYERIKEIAKKEESFYVYDQKIIEKQIRNLKTNFPTIQFLYSIKCNPNKDLLKIILKHGLGADAASLNEVLLAASYGLSKEMIYYSSPGKTNYDLKESMNYATIIVDSLLEIERISQISNQAVKIGIRINPDFSFNDLKGNTSKFGIDEKQIIELIQNWPYSNIQIIGIHVHLKSQELDRNKLEFYYSNLIHLANRIERILGYPLSFINMGSGIGIAYSRTDQEINLKTLGKNTTDLIYSYQKSHPDTRIMIETGRYVVCQSGYYVSHVVDKKKSYDKTYVIIQNTLNGFIRPSLARFVSNYNQDSQKMGYEPLFTKEDAFQLIVPYSNRELEKVTITGNLCTAADMIVSDQTLPKIEVGDIILISNAGSYGAVLSPMQFSMIRPIKEYIINTSKKKVNSFSTYKKRNMPQADIDMLTLDRYESKMLDEE